MAQAFSVSVHITKNELPQLPARGRRKASQAVRRAGFGTRRASVPFTPVDIGDLRNNVVLEISNGGLTAHLKWLMHYAIYQNEGTSRGVTAKQFAQKGAEAARPQFESDMAGIYGEGV